MSGQHRLRISLMDRVFWISLLLKGIDGLLEIIGGILFLLVKPEQLDALVRVLTQHELAEDPGDFLANSLLRASGGLTLEASWFAAAYLLLHGAVKVVLVWAVLKNRLWAYPWMIAFLVIFIGYQSYQLVTSFSIGMFFLTIFDLFVVWLTVREFRIHRHRALKGTTTHRR
ncbi:DUF2127 domain-containing protein [Glutamicibacter sp.]|uniref:DUF2127 domain-containing protein n=1 Tax=Glutamicibacter sp. TaxID=1931995 RepID=UPI0028BDE14D|nr:DUF2127 domain-containing protein [Glutamicibacter sp.]